MSIETRLREGSEAIKQATRQADYTSRSPAQKRAFNGPAVAWATGLALVALFAIPAMLGWVGGQPPGSVDIGASQTFPHLALDLPDTRVSDAYDVIDEATGDRVGTHTIYSMTLTDGTDGTDRYTGREVLLRVQEPGTDFSEFDYYSPLAQSTETVVVDGREVTVYLIPDEEIEEGTYDQGILQWTEPPGYEVVLIPWGLDTDGALALMNSLTTISQSEWNELNALQTEPNKVTAIEEDVLSPLMPRVVIDLPGFEIVDGSEAQDGPAHWHGEWQIRIGDTAGTITLDSNQTAPSQTFTGYDTPESVTVAGTPGLLGQHHDGFVVEWERDERITVSIDGTDLDPNDVIAAIHYVEEATWIDLLPNTTR